MPSRSEAEPQPTRRRRSLIVAAVVAAIVAVPVVRVAADVINTGQFIVTEDAVRAEDVYVAASRGVVEGMIEGDLIIATGSLVVSGTVTGDVLVAVRGRVTIEGTVEGSLRGVARSLAVSGTVGDDIAVAAAQIDVTGDVGRDVIGLGVTAALDGAVGRDVKGRFRALAVGGAVGRDVDVTVRELRLGPNSVVSGDVVYQADREVDLADGAHVGGQVIQLPTEAPFYVGLVLDVAYLLGFLGYLVGGVALLWLLRRSGAHAVSVATRHPGLSIGVGLAAAVGIPALTVALIATLVGVPLAVVLLLAFVAAVLFASVPAVAAVGVKMLGGRGGVYGGFLAGAVTWRVLAAIVPFAGAVLFITAEIWGTGSWLVGGWRARAAPIEGGFGQSISENSRLSIPNGVSSPLRSDEESMP